MTDPIGAVTAADAPGPSNENPHWVKYYVDGGTFMAGRRTHVTRGIYWSIRCEDGHKEPFFIRKQNDRFKTNNDAEWLAFKEALMHAVETGVTMPIVIYSDSMIVVNQFNGKWRTKVERHHRIKTECVDLASKLKFVALQWVPREVNVDKLGH